MTYISTRTIADDVSLMLRMEYVNRGVSLRSLADKHDLDFDELRQIADLEDWHDERMKFIREIYYEAREATKKSIISTYQNTANLANMMSAWAVQQFENENGKLKIDPDNVNKILRTISTNLEVMKFTMGDPSTFVADSQGKDKPATTDEMMEDYERMLKKQTGRPLLNTDFDDE